METGESQGCQMPFEHHPRIGDVYRNDEWTFIVTYVYDSGSEVDVVWIDIPSWISRDSVESSRLRLLDSDVLIARCE